MEYGLIAEHLSHSFSKEIHESFGRYSYELHELPEGELETFLKERSFKGINVTIPYKERVIPFLDHVDDAALKIGAVNTIVNENGVLKGYNTDYYGLKSLIERKGFSFFGKDVLILGTGGTSKTAYHVATDLGAASVTKVSRREGNGAISYQTALARKNSVRFIINTTPVGMYPNCDACPMDISGFECLEGVIDCIYNPFNSDLVRKASEMGVSATGGLYMLVMQAVKAVKLFTGEDIDHETVQKVYLDIKLKKSTVSLIGLPAVGKTTIGKLMASEFGLRLVDTDEMIVQKAGISIPEIFERYGEDHFRELEKEAVKEASLMPGSVIATGGGCVKYKENMDNLKRSGIVIFLDRDSLLIKPSEDRPLSDTEDKLKALARERMPLYRKYADHTVSLTGRPADNLDKIRSVLNAY